MSVVLVGTGARAHQIYQSLKRNRKDVIGVLSSFEREGKDSIAKRFADVPLFNIVDAPKADHAIVVSKHGTNLDRVQQLDGLYDTIYVEKPLFLLSNEEQPNNFRSNIRLLYNRRFYKSIQTLKASCKSSQVKSLSVLYSEKTNDKQRRYGHVRHEDRSTIFFIHLLDILQYVIGIPSLVWKSKKKSNFCGLADSVLEANGAEIFVRFVDNIGTSSRIDGWLQDSTYFELSPLEILRMWRDGGAINCGNQRIYGSVFMGHIQENDYGIDSMIQALGTNTDTFCTIEHEKQKLQLLKKWYYD